MNDDPRPSARTDRSIAERSHRPDVGLAARPTPTDGTAVAFDHGAVSRFNAWFFHVFDRYINHVARRHKRAAFGGIDAEVVVEIGAGVGANLDYLPATSRLVAIEPSLRMHDRLRARTDAAGIDLELLARPAEQLPLEDSAYDEVICSLVLCTVADPDGVLAEVRRILRPGGRFRFVEHVAAPSWSPRRWLQRALRRPWAWLFEGCTLDRDTAAVVRAAGFSEVQVERARFRRSVFVPANTTIWGVATR